MPCGDNIRRFRYHIPQLRHLRGHGHDRDDGGGGDHVHDPCDRDGDAHVRPLLHHDGDAHVRPLLHHDGDARARHRLHHGGDDAHALLLHGPLLRFVQIRFPESSLLMLQQSASQTCEY